MFTALFSFLGSTVFRWALGEVFDWLKAKQNHDQQIELMKLQVDLQSKQSEINLAQMKATAEMGIKEVEVKRDADVAVRDADAFLEAVKSVGIKTGIYVVDLWNGLIRPQLAQIAIILWVLAMYQEHWVLSQWDKDLIASVLGLYCGGRIRATGR